MHIVTLKFILIPILDFSSKPKKFSLLDKRAKVTPNDFSFDLKAKKSEKADPIATPRRFL